MTPSTRPTQIHSASTSPAWAAPLAPLRVWWRACNGREQRALRLAVAVLSVATLCTLLVAPAWRTLQSAGTLHAHLNAQWAEMHTLAAEATRLRNTPVMAPEQAAAALTAVVTRLGSKAQLSIQGERAVVKLQGMALHELRPWWLELRAGARTRPVEMSLQSDAGGYSGRLVLVLPAPP